MGQRRYDGVRIGLQWRAEPDAHTYSCTDTNADSKANAHTYSGTKTNADAYTYADTRAADGIADLDLIRWSKGESLEHYQFSQAQQSGQCYDDDQLGQADGGHRLHDRVVNLHSGQNAGQGGVVHGRSEIHSS